MKKPGAGGRKAVVSVPYSGSRLLDWRRAERALRELFEDPAWTRPRGWVWHHLGDGRTLQLVPAGLHGELPHTGMAAGTPPGGAPPRAAGPPASPLPLAEPGSPLSQRLLEGVERDLEVRLPDSYRRLLAAANGGRPAAPAFRAAAGTDEVLDRFLSLGSGDEDDLLAWLERYGDRLPDGFLPIAHDPFGNLIGLDLGAPGAAGVLLWDHELEPEGDEDERANLFPLATDFDAFLASFFADEPAG